MIKKLFLLTFFFFIAVRICYSGEDQRNSQIKFLIDHPELLNKELVQIPTQKELSIKGRQLLETRGFKVLGAASKLVFPRTDSLAKNNNIVRVAVSLKLNRSGIKPIYMDTPFQKNTSSLSIDTIMTEDFEKDFPGTKWQRTGDPTWGKSEYQKHNGSYSAWCTKDDTKGIQPGQGYLKNCNAMMIYGPFDLKNVNYAQLQFWYNLDTEPEKDWFYYMASTDGDNFKGVGIAGETYGWEKEILHLSNVPGLGNATDRSQVWIAFLFESDDDSTSDKGVFIDDVELTKRRINGTPLAGAVSGKLTKLSNPYVAVGDFGIAEGDTLEIKPGVEIRIENGFAFNIFGLLKAIGTPSDSIVFTSAKENPSPGDWEGIGLYDVASKDCRIQYCRIEYGGLYEAGIYADIPGAEISNCLIWKNKNAGISCGNSFPGSTVKDCRITKNGYGVYGILASAVITNNLIAENRIGIGAALLSAFYIKDNIIENNIEDGVVAGISAPIIVHNTIRNNGFDGIEITGSLGYSGVKLVSVDNLIVNNGIHGIRILSLVDSAKIINNIIAKNRWNGLSFENQSSTGFITIQNNTITQNSGHGIECGSEIHNNSYIINNIISDNIKSGIHFLNFKSSYIRYNNFYNNNPNFYAPETDSLGILSQTNISGNQCDPHFNISLAPLFVNSSNNNFQLLQNSPCRNAGDPSIFFNDTDGSVNDMGAYGGNLLNINFTEYDFGAYIVKNTTKVVLQIENNRSTNFTISSLKLSDITNFSISQNVPISISPYKQINITITFKPQSIGNYSAVLTISSKDFLGTGSALVVLSGKCINGTIIQNSISGTWLKSGSPYIISDYTQVLKNKKLIIEPGVEIRFNGPYGLAIYGQLQAIGTEKEPIVFTRHRTSEDSEGEGIRIYSESVSDTTKIIYCIVEKMTKIDDSWGRLDTAAIAIFRAHGPVIINHSRISFNKGPAFDCDKSIFIIENSLITDNGGNAFNLRESQVEIKNCIIKNNKGIGVNSGWISNNIINIRNNIIKENQAGGLHIEYSSANLFNNIIINNSSSRGGAIFINESSLLIINNIISGNMAKQFGGGLYLVQILNRSLGIMNNIIRNNTAPSGSQIYNDSFVTLPVSYNNVQGGWSGEGNIDIDPKFIDPVKDNFQLQPSSKCIDKGNPDRQYNDPENLNNSGFALYPAQGTVRNDMGVFGGPLAVRWENITTSINPRPEEMVSLPKKFELFQNYPNPFNPETFIKYQLPQNTDISIKVYNIYGQLVKTLLDEKRDAGYYSVIWNGLDNKDQRVASGIYFYKLHSEKFVKIKKMIVVR